MARSQLRLPVVSDKYASDHQLEPIDLSVTTLDTGTSEQDDAVDWVCGTCRTVLFAGISGVPDALRGTLLKCGCGALNRVG
jgi:hypothetical protein